MPLVYVIRSITAGLLKTSEGPIRVTDEALGSVKDRVGLRGVSVLPSRLGALSRLARLDTPFLSPTATLSRLPFAESWRGLGVTSLGLLILLRPDARPGSSSRIVRPRADSGSLNAVAVTGAITALTFVGMAVIPIFGRFWTFGEGFLDADAAVMDDDLED